MGADFSLLRPPQAAPPRRRTRRQRLHNYPAQPLLPSAPSSTRANTLANRSPISVSRHVALARLAQRLSSMGKRRRDHVIEQLDIPHDMLEEVRRYTPSNSFASTADHDDWHHPLSDPSQCSSASVCSEIDDPDPQQVVKPSRTRKIVSFAKYAEMRLF